METFSAQLALSAGNSPVPVNSPHKGQGRGALMFSLICVWINGWVNNREAGDFRRHRGHYDVNVMGTVLSQRPGSGWGWTGRGAFVCTVERLLSASGYRSLHPDKRPNHYSDVIMSTMASLITCLASVNSTVHPGADQRKHQSSASLAFVLRIHRRPVNYKWSVTQKMFPFDDVIMLGWLLIIAASTACFHTSRGTGTISTWYHI